MSDKAQPGQGAPIVDPLGDTVTVERPQGSPPPVEDRGAAGNPLEGFPALAPGRTLAGRYTVLGLLGQGGMGVVLAAYDSRLDRRVALKLLHPKAGSGSAELRARMEREAQAMARLSHPNVVSVYDAGTLGDGSILIAMEMVEGQTLRSWCAQEPRTWREILAAHVAAGHGLAAAHAAGLIHRDFKPENVLVGRDGRVRVTDFGLARADSDPHPEPIPGAPQPMPPGDWERALTLPGTLLGTPRYMAPELVQGRPADARSDVFSFCVALYEALYGQHPFPGSNLAELHRAQLEGRVNPPPSQSEVPAWVARAVLHGLRAEPSQRSASMGALLAALQDDPEVRLQSRRRGVLLATVMVGLAGLAVWGWLAREQGAGCDNLDRKLAGAWDPEVKEKMRQSFLGTGLPYAQDSFARVSTLLDGYAGAWVKARTRACEAGQQQAQQARDLAVLQVYCLERRHSQLQTLTGLFSQGLARESLPRAVLAVQSLPPLEYCADAKALMAAVPLPEDPAVRARVESLQDQVARLDALNLAGRYREGLALGDELLRQVEGVGYVPLHAHALYQVAALRGAVSDYAGAETLLRQAIPLAAQGRELVLEARAWNLLVRMMGVRQGRYHEALGLRLTVEAAVERAADAQVHGAWLHTLGSVFFWMGKYEESREQYERSLSILEKTLGPDHPDVTGVLIVQGRLFISLGDYEKARMLLERVVSLREKTLGPDHPGVAPALSLLGSVLWYMGRYEEAKARLERMRTIREKALGAEHPDTAIALAKSSLVLHALGQYEEAKALAERALSFREKAQGPNCPEMPASLNALGLVLHGMGQYEKAKAQHERALTFCERQLEADPSILAEAFMRLGRAQVHLGQFDEAHLHFERARSILGKVFGREHPELAEVHLGMGELLLARGKPAEAVPQLEHALVLAPGRVRAEAQFTLARALWLAGKERSRALSLAMSARQHYQDIAHGSKLAEVSRWLASNPGPVAPERSR